MTERTLQIGIAFPQTEFGSDPLAIRDFAQAAEDIGFNYMVAYDHVVGAGVATRPDWKGPYTEKDTFQEPLMLFSYLAGVTRHIAFTTGVVILPQRQTVLFGKQAANLDIYCHGRLTIGVGLGWNEVEYEALGVPFKNRGTRADDQIQLLRRLWTEPTFSLRTAFHCVSEAGINPLPVQRPIPIWVGGDSPAAMDRAARLGDGWMPVARPSKGAELLTRFREALHHVGRNPEDIGFQGHVTVGAHLGRVPCTPEQAAQDVDVWKEAGATHVVFDAMRNGLCGPDAHTSMMRRFAGALGLRRAA
jgi:probable F420-dependent oxidoreductase